MRNIGCAYSDTRSNSCITKQHVCGLLSYCVRNSFTTVSVLFEGGNETDSNFVCVLQRVMERCSSQQRAGLPCRKHVNSDLQLR